MTAVYVFIFIAAASIAMMVYMDLRAKKASSPYAADGQVVRMQDESLRARLFSWITGSRMTNGAGPEVAAQKTQLSSTSSQDSSYKPLLSRSETTDESVANTVVQSTASMSKFGGSNVGSTTTPTSAFPTDAQVRAYVNKEDQEKIKRDNLLAARQNMANMISLQVRSMSAAEISPLADPNYKPPVTQTPPEDLVQATKARRFIAH
jgi:hypothetical protein